MIEHKNARLKKYKTHFHFLIDREQVKPLPIHSGRIFLSSLFIKKKSFRSLVRKFHEFYKEYKDVKEYFKHEI